MNDNSRVTKITIGAAIICLLTWWLITGTVDRLVSMPVENQGLNLSSSASFGLKLLADAAYVVGVAVTAVLSGLWSIIQRLIEQRISPSQSSESVSVDLLKSGLKQVRDPLRADVVKLSARLDALEKKSASAPSKPAPRKRAPTKKAGDK